MKENIRNNTIFKLIKRVENFGIDQFRIRQYNKILNELDLPYYQKILDIGCGDGLFSYLLYKRSKNLFSKTPEITALDMEEDVIRENKEKHPFINFKTSDFYDIPKNLEFKNKTFDLVIAKDVLHHSNDPFLAYKLIRSLGKNILIIESNKENGWLSMFKGHDHFSVEEFKKIVEDSKICFLDIFYPVPKIMAIFGFSPYIPKSKNAFMVMYSKK